MVGSRANRALGALVGLAATLGMAGWSAAQAGTPALVVDVASGRVLHAERATDPWYPASITKLMTTYVALDMVRRGEARLDQLLTLSPAAAAQPPSKMGFKPGTQLTLDNALKIIMVKSANDIAMMIGENLGGSVEGYADKMNEAARRLGMHESTWANSNGLFDERQHTSARDMAIVALALLREFPEHEGLFHIGAVQLGRQVIRNHNGLLGRYPGADGMKTGFICAGGFNIVSTATQNGRRIMAVVFGYPSARERDLRTADLLDEGFSKASGFSFGQQKLEDLAPSSLLAPPDMRQYGVCSPHRRQPQDDDEQSVVARNDATGGGLTALFSGSSTFASPNTSNEPTLGTRRTFGPQVVAAAPIKVWLGASPDAAPDAGTKVRATPVQIAAKPVRTKPLSRNAAGGQLPSTAQAFTSVPAGDPAIPVVRTAPKAVPAPALKANIEAKPAAEVKPKPGQIGSGAGRSGGHGAIASRQPEPIMAPAEGDAKPARAAAKVKPQPVKASAAKPARKPTKPAKPATQASAADEQ